jgi:hypothetical protein
MCFYDRFKVPLQGKRFPFGIILYGLTY